MKNKLPFRTALIVCCAVLIVSFSLAAIPLLTGNDDLPAEIPENSYEPAEAEPSVVLSSEETEFACAMYIGGRFAGFYEDVSHAKEELEKQKNALLEQCGVQYIKATFTDEVTFKSELYPVSSISSASGLSFPELNVELEYYETVTAPVAYSVEYRDNAGQYSGKEKVLTEGRDGCTETTYLVVMRGNDVVSRTAVAENIISVPVNCVIERGVKAKKSAADITPIFVLPYDGAFTSEYGTRYLMGSTFHKGVDVSGINDSSECYGKEIHAAGDGVVIHAGWSDGFGYLVILEHANGMHTYYAHQKKVACRVGDVVKQGDVIGYIGSSGRSTGPHVHFEIRVPDEDGKYYAIDPEPYIIDYDSYPHRG